MSSSAAALPACGPGQISKHIHGYGNPSGSIYPNSRYIAPKVPTSMGTTLRPMYVLFGYMDPSGIQPVFFIFVYGAVVGTPRASRLQR